MEAERFRFVAVERTCRCSETKAWKGSRDGILPEHHNNCTFAACFHPFQVLSTISLQAFAGWIKRHSKDDLKSITEAFHSSTKRSYQFPVIVRSENFNLLNRMQSSVDKSSRLVMDWIWFGIFIRKASQVNFAWLSRLMVRQRFGCYRYMSARHRLRTNIYHSRMTNPNAEMRNKNIKSHITQGEKWLVKSSLDRFASVSQQFNVKRVCFV